MWHRSQIAEQDDPQMVIRYAQSYLSIGKDGETESYLDGLLLSQRMALAGR